MVTIVITSQPKVPRTVLVTGAARGLGLETALTLAASDWQVWAAVRSIESKDAVDAAARERGVRLHVVPMDVTNAASIEATVEQVVRDSGGLDALVNNAGVTARAYFEDFPEKEIRRLFEVNLFGVMNVTRRVLPHMRARRRGRIVMISSIGGRIGSMCIAPYIATKFGLEGFSESLSLELKPLGIDVVIIEPGLVATELWQEQRRVLPSARNPQSPYYKWFREEEKLAEAVLKSSHNAPSHVAEKVLLALSVRRPRLRYVVGRRAQAVLSLRRHLPGELFERIYFGEILRRIARPA